MPKTKINALKWCFKKRKILHKIVKNYAKNSGSAEKMEEILKKQKEQEKIKKQKKLKQKQKYDSDKNKYFAYYDDIKHSSHKVIDW